MNRYRHRSNWRSLSSISFSSLSRSFSSSFSRLYHPQQEQKHRNSNNERKKSGVYGLVGLHAPKDFERLAADVIDRVNDIISDIKGKQEKKVLRKHRSNTTVAAGVVEERIATWGEKNIVHQLDEISDTICAVVDVAELCRNTHPDREFVQAAERTYLKLQNFVQTLNGT